jgi:hypothetical protein
MLALKPYWGKPAVRDFRGDDGNAGIIEARSAPSSYSTALTYETVDHRGIVHRGFGERLLDPFANVGGGI